MPEPDAPNANLPAATGGTSLVGRGLERLRGLTLKSGTALSTAEDAEAMWNQGRIVYCCFQYIDDETRFGVVDPVGAYEWFRKAADTGHPECLWRMGVLHMFDFPWLGQEWDSRTQGLAGDARQEALISEALEWYRRAAENSPKHMVRLAEEFSPGGQLPQDHAEALTWCRRAAETGDAYAMRNMAWIYEEGRLDLAEDHAEALKWHRRAAETGDAYAMRNMAWIYEEGRLDLAEDHAEALKWHRRAAETGDASAMRNMALIYEEGRLGLAEDHAEALKWYRRAAETGDAYAMRNMALIYEEGRLAEDRAEALKWYRRAAETGDASAMRDMALIYEEGRLAEDRAEALKWYRRAAATTDYFAMMNMGDIHGDGRLGLPVNPTLAKRWKSLAYNLERYHGMDWRDHLSDESDAVAEPAVDSPLESQPPQPARPETFTASARSSFTWRSQGK
ncbi:tetratricopeptide repeat protein [Brevundimonas diminuta]|uniref:tetratricopeptide repeat protein n=1 Tax=Brevundimonas diminuta TaxID=293 RepID=UPI0030F502D8